jgi:hypothetical protein
VTAGEPTPSWRGKLKNLKVSVVLVLVLTTLVLGIWSLMAYTGSLYGAERTGTADEWGVATATSCTETGPVSQMGIGYYWRCAAAVQWKSGPRTGRSTFEELEPGVLTRDDVGKPVRVWWGKTNKHSGFQVKRDAERPYQWIGVAGLVAPFAFVAGVAVWATVRHRRKVNTGPLRPGAGPERTG